VLPLEGLEKAVFEMNGVKYLSFEVAKLRGEDKFGRTHTCYYQTKVTSAIPTQDEAAEKQKKTSKKKSKKTGCRIGRGSSFFGRKSQESRKAFLWCEMFS
jgi:hypothetical protein